MLASARPASAYWGLAAVAWCGWWKSGLCRARPNYFAFLFARKIRYALRGAKGGKPQPSKPGEWRARGSRHAFRSLLTISDDWKRVAGEVRNWPRFGGPLIHPPLKIRHSMRSALSGCWARRMAVGRLLTATFEWNSRRAVGFAVPVRNGIHRYM